MTKSVKRCIRSRHTVPTNSETGVERACSPGTTYNREAGRHIYRGVPQGIPLRVVYIRVYLRVYLSGDI